MDLFQLPSYWLLIKMAMGDQLCLYAYSEIKSSEIKSEENVNIFIKIELRIGFDTMFFYIKCN